MQKLSEYVYKIQRWLSLVLLALLCIVTFLQVFARYVLNYPLYWSEELARYVFVWLTFIGFGIAVQRRSEMSVAYFVDLLSEKTKVIIEFGIRILTLLFLLLATYQGVILAFESWDILTIALELPWTYIYLAIPVGFFLIFFQYLARLMLLYQELREAQHGNEGHAGVPHTRGGGQL